MWRLTHRDSEAGDVSTIERDEPSSADAIAAARALLPEGHKLLAIRAGKSA
jgi:hypothetical protein